MANVTIGFGLALALLGVGGYMGTDRVSLTALIPLALGALLVLCGALARRPALHRHAMHAAAVVALAGVLGPLRVLPQMAALVAGRAVPHQAAVLDQLLLLVVCAVLLGLYIRSFVAARRARTS
jgi:hypothetical protein